MLPLGIDLGSSRIRMAAAERSRSGETRIRAVAARDLPSAEDRLQIQLIAALVEEMTRELGVRERRCVASLGAPHAEMRVMQFPKMTWAERLRAARFEGERFARWDVSLAAATVRVHAHNRDVGSYGVGVARREALQQIVDVCKAAGLCLAAVDFDACAFQRAIQSADAIVDIGLDRSTLHTYGADGPISYPIPVGGSMVTKGIASELAIDAASAERRKRILGCAGAGSASLDQLAVSLAECVSVARARRAINRVALVGNGARLPGLATVVESATHAAVEIPVSELLDGDAYPEDVLRAAAPDWTLAAALAAWTSA
jgi:Tfp pilus assembly PilM family ATPase